MLNTDSVLLKGNESLRKLMQQFLKEIQQELQTCITWTKVNTNLQVHIHFHLMVDRLGLQLVNTKKASMVKWI